MAHPLTPYQETRSHKANRLQGKPLPSSGSALHGNGNMTLDQNVILGVLDTLKGDMPPKFLAYIIQMPHGQIKSLAFLLGQVQNGIDIDWLSDVILSEDPSHQQQPPRPLTPSALVKRHPSVQSGHSQMTDWSGNTCLAPTLGSHESWQLPGCSSTKEIPEENNSLYGALDDGTLYHPYPANYANLTLAFETSVPDKLHHTQPIHSHPSVSVDVDQDLGPAHQYPLNSQQSFLLEDEAEPYEGSPKQSVPSSSSNCPGFHEHSPAGFNYHQSFVPTSTSESKTPYSGPTYYRGSQKIGPTTKSERALLNKILKTSSMAFIDYQHPQRSKEICRSVCPKCSSDFVNRNELAAHVEAEHDRPFEYLCSHCAFSTYRYAHFQRHHTTAHKNCSTEQPDASTDSPCRQVRSTGPLKRIWGCYFCVWHFSDIHSWAKHHIDKHKGLKSNQLSFTWLIKSLLSHEKLHVLWQMEIEQLEKSTGYHWQIKWSEEAIDEERDALIQELETTDFFADAIACQTVVKSAMDATTQHKTQLEPVQNDEKSGKRPPTSSPTGYRRPRSFRDRKNIHRQKSSPTLNKAASDDRSSVSDCTRFEETISGLQRLPVRCAR